MKEALFNYELIEPLLFALGLLQILRNRMGGALFLILFLLEGKFFIGSTTSSFLFPHNYTDTANILFVFLIIRLSLRKPLLDTRPTKMIKWGVISFALFLLVVISVDLMFNDSKPVAVLKFCRNWIILILVFFIDKIRKPEIEAFLRYLLILTVVFSAILIFEFLFSVRITGAKSHLGYRATVQSWTALFVFLLLIRNYYRLGTLLKWTCITIITIETILAASRSGLIAYVIAGLAAFIFPSSISLLRKISLFSLLTIGLLALFSFENEVSKRFDDASQEMEATNGMNNGNSGSFSFRLLLMAERAAYVSEKPQRILFGIGTVQEKDFPTVFKIGYEKNRDRPNQIDTGDNAWAPLMLRMGFLGIGVYLTTIFLPFIMFFYRHRKNVMSYCLLLYILVSLFIISFTYSEIAFSGFWFMPIILIAPLLTGFERKRTLYASRNVI